MKIKSLFLATILGATMVSCSNDELDNQLTSSSNAIGFNVLNNSTRATIVNADNIKDTEFSVYAYTQSGALFMGAIDTYLGYNGTKIDYIGDKWDYVNDADMRYWPTEDQLLDFYAINPTPAAATTPLYPWKVTPDTLEIHYTSFNEYGGESADRPNIDVMYAVAKNQKKSTNNGFVKFNFHHILSQVSFQAKVERSDMEVEINKMAIHNVCFAGVFKYPTAIESSAPQLAYWTSKRQLRTDSETEWEGNGNVSIPCDSGVTVNSTESATDISLSKPALVIPQVLNNPWNGGGQIANADVAGVYKSYIKVSCKIKQNSYYLYGSADAYADLFIPFTATWEPGKRYVYTIIFGGGYDENGDKVLNPIKFDVETVDGWVESSSNVDARV